MTLRSFIPLNIAVLTVSDTRTEADDTSGQLLIQLLADAGHTLGAKVIVPDNKYAIRAQMSAWIADPAVHGVITTGGTGLTGRDGTPEAVQPLLDKAIDGFGELFRALSYQEIGTSALQSRCLAGIANGTFIFCLPGSRNACRTGWEKLIAAQLDHRTAPCNLAMLIPRVKEQ